MVVSMEEQANGADIDEVPLTVGSTLMGPFAGIGNNAAAGDITLFAVTSVYH